MVRTSGVRGSDAASWGAWRGSGTRAVGTVHGAGIEQAGADTDRQHAIPHARRPRPWRSGRSASGRRGMATSRAACAGSSASGGTPNQASEPARTPSRLPPNGARVSQMSSTPRRPKRASSCTARAISISLERRVRGRGSSRRAACIASVEPPETTWPVRRNCAVARTRATGSTPGWYQKRRSSTATSRLVSSGGAVLGAEAPDAAGGGKQRERPVLAIQHLGAHRTEAREIGREGVIQRRAEGGEQTEQRRQEAEKCARKREPGRRTQRTKHSPSPCGRGLGEGAGGRPPPPNPLPQGEGE